MCSARMDPDLILEAFRQGAGMVLVLRCHPQDCHYITGQLVGRDACRSPAEALVKQMGISPERFRVEWISAAEGDKYARVINEMQKSIDGIGKDKLKAQSKDSSQTWKNAPGACMTCRV